MRFLHHQHPTRKSLLKNRKILVILLPETIVQVICGKYPSETNQQCVYLFILKFLQFFILPFLQFFNLEMKINAFFFFFYFFLFFFVFILIYKSLSICFIFISIFYISFSLFLLLVFSSSPCTCHYPALSCIILSIHFFIEYSMKQKYF